MHFFLVQVFLGILANEEGSRLKILLQESLIHKLQLYLIFKNPTKFNYDKKLLSN
jgi:hypothetical protein